MWKCLNKRVLIGLGVVAVAVVVLAPNLFGAALPLLFVAACPLSMIFMMRAMGGGEKSGSSPSNGNESAATDDAARLRELEEEVNRLKAMRHLRGNDRSGA